MNLAVATAGVTPQSLTEAFSPPPSMNGNVNALAGTLASIPSPGALQEKMANIARHPIQMLMSDGPKGCEVQQRPDFNQRLLPYFAAIQAAAANAEQSISTVLSDIEGFGQKIAALPPRTVPLTGDGLISELASQANAAEANCPTASAKLDTYRNSINSAISAFSTAQNEIAANNARLQGVITDGRLSPQGVQEFDGWIQLNKNLAGVLSSINQSMMGTASAAASLQTNWSELGGRLGGIEPLLAVVTPSVWQETLQAVKQTWEQTMALVSNVEQ